MSDASAATKGLGGVLRARPEDFLVEEVPLFRASGRGDHALCLVEKRAASTFEVLLWLSKAAKVSEHSIGYGGLKDASAVARQYVTVPKTDPDHLRDVRQPRFHVLSAARHGQALKIGWLRGNRFRIRIRDVDLSAVPAARSALEEMVRDGMPNAYGEQRFGLKSDGHLIGRAVVAQDWTDFAARLLGQPSAAEKDPRVRAAREAFDAGDAELAFRLFPLRHRVEKKALAALLRTGSVREAFVALGKRTPKIWVSAWQSHCFNRVLARREAEGTHGRLLAGDVAWLHASGACYPVVDEATEADRAATLAASPTAPLVGYDLRLAEGRPGEIERAVLREEGAEPEAFRPAHARARGARRPMRVPVREASLDAEPDGSVLVRFLLPPGSFATVLLSRLMGSRAAEEPPDDSAAEGPEDASDVPDRG